MRIIPLALRFSWASRGRTALLAVLVAVCMCVLLIVTELTRVSTEGLSDAVLEDVGDAGTHVIRFNSGLGLTQQQLTDTTMDVLAEFGPRSVVRTTALPTITAECPPFEAIGPQPALFVDTILGDPLTIEFGEGLPPDASFCLEGQVIPADAIHLTTRSEERMARLGIIFADEYEPLILASTTGPVEYIFWVVTGREVDESTQISQALNQAYRDRFDKYGVPPLDYISVVYSNEGASVRGAAQGTELVYGVIAWGVLILAALGVLIAESVAVSHRMWFFGLSRALGASRLKIAALVFADVAVIVLLGAAVAAALLFAAQPVVGDFAQQTFALQANLTRGSQIPQLVGGALVVLVLAGVYPAVRATRQDPVDVLEPGGS